MTKPTSPVRRFFRVWFPFWVIGLAAVSIGVAWNLPYENLTRMVLTITVWLAVMLTVLLLSVWLVFLSGLGWLRGLALLVLIGAVWYLAVDEVKYDGDMIPQGIR